MCKLKSAIVLKDRIFMPEYDSHSDMLNELGIKDDYLGASKKFVRVELSPKDGNVFSDIDGWELIVDQDIRPEWFSEDECKPKMVEAVKEWAKTHIHIGVGGLKIESGKNHYIKDCKNVAIINSTVEAWDNSTVKACDNSTVKAWGNSTVEAWGNSTVMNNPYLTWHKQNALVIADNATFKDKIGKVIYQSGSYKLISVESGKTIGEAK